MFLDIKSSYFGKLMVCFISYFIFYFIYNCIFTISKIIFNLPFFSTFLVKSLL